MPRGHQPVDSLVAQTFDRCNKGVFFLLRRDRGRLGSAVQAEYGLAHMSGQRLDAGVVKQQRSWEAVVEHLSQPISQIDRHKRIQPEIAERLARIDLAVGGVADHGGGFARNCGRDERTASPNGRTLDLELAPV